MKDEIKYDQRNYRDHDERNLSLIKKSIQRCGAGRSILLDKNGEIIAGNATYKTLQELGIPVKIIPTDGKTAIALQRTDLDTNMTKIYLKTPEDVIKALKDGKEVRDENNYSFKIVDGFIVATCDDYFYIGYTIYGIDKPYILEEEPLKIEVGKWYETRDHQKARCFAITAQGKCYSFTIDNGFVFYTHECGKYGVEKECSLDIIGPWEE